MGNNGNSRLVRAAAVRDRLTVALTLAAAVVTGLLTCPLVRSSVW